jgi:glycosyltransferase involved in cell wall biosynthesis
VGRAIPLQNPEQVIGDLERTLMEVVGSPAAWAERGTRGRARVEQRYTWESKIAAAEALYEQLGLDGRPARVGSVEAATQAGHSARGN